MNLFFDSLVDWERWSEATPLILMLVTLLAVLVYNWRQRRQQDCVQHRVDRVLELCGGKTSGVDSHGLTALGRVMEEGDDFEAVSELVSRGADPNQRGRDGLTPLMKAVDGNRPGCLASLILAEADENQRDADGRTALMRAVLAHRTECVRQFVLGGTSLNAQDQEGMTALMHAVAAGQADCVKLLLDDNERGANCEPIDLSLRDHQGRTALGIAEQMGYSGIVAMLRASLS